MADSKTMFANLGVLWRGKEDRRNKDVVMNGKLTAEACVFLGIHAGASLIVMKNDKGDNANRPDYRLMIVVGEDEAQASTSPLGGDDDF